jgi:hypothetical protein
MKFKDRVNQYREMMAQQKLAKQGIVDPRGTIPSPEIPLVKQSLGEKAVNYFGNAIQNFGKGIANKIGTGINNIIPQKQIQMKFTQPTPTPTPTPTPSNFQFIPKTVGITVPEPYKFQPPQGIMADAIRKSFPQEATQAATVAWSENATNPYHTEAYNFNTPGDNRITPGFEGSADYGPFQINDKTMQDYIRRMPGEMMKIGVNNVKDLKDPYKASAFAALIRKFQGWKAWKGWQDKGVTGL